jgi:diadenosine tetraphosphatase ApaH/serine/threonine PP2A family protein phosphatase
MLTAGYHFVILCKTCYILGMKYYAILADIHSNLAAFQAVLKDMEGRGTMEEIWCLGDIVGYGPDPHECIELLKGYNHVCIAGNHDLAAIGKVDTAYFNSQAAAACQWTAGQLTTEDRSYLGNLPLTLESDEFTLAHGSPREPIWEYVISLSIARDNFEYFQTNYCLVGHSHVPVIFRYSDEGKCSSNTFQPGVGLILGKDRLIINPGGVGQPRDGDPRASYAIYESEGRTVKLYRVEYDVSLTQYKMTERRLPPQLIARLSHGI